jgi:hypothetical protein
MRCNCCGWSVFVRRLLLGSCCLLVLLLGCRRSATGDLSGEVRVNGQLLTGGGSVVFLAADGEMKGAVIGSDGRYQVRGLAPGVARVGVASHPPVPPGLFHPGGPEKRRAQPPEKVVVLPERLGKPETSGIEVTVVGGSQPFNIDLTP